MKRILIVLLVACTWATTLTNALPLLQHTANGIVRAVDLDRRRLSLENTARDLPTEYLVVSGRTRLRHNRRPAELEELPAGQPVHLHYKRESIGAVATEITWESVK